MKRTLKIKKLLKQHQVEAKKARDNELQHLDKVFLEGLAKEKLEQEKELQQEQADAINVLKQAHHVMMQKLQNDQITREIKLIEDHCTQQQEILFEQTNQQTDLLLEQHKQQTALRNELSQQQKVLLTEQIRDQKQLIADQQKEQLALYQSHPGSNIEHLTQKHKELDDKVIKDYEAKEQLLESEFKVVIEELTKTQEDQKKILLQQQELTLTDLQKLHNEMREEVKLKKQSVEEGSN